MSDLAEFIYESNKFYRFEIPFSKHDYRLLIVYDFRLTFDAINNYSIIGTLSEISYLKYISILGQETSINLARIYFVLAYPHSWRSICYGTLFLRNRLQGFYRIVGAFFHDESAPRIKDEQLAHYHAECMKERHV